MSEWVDRLSSMTGSTNPGPLQAQKDHLLHPVRSLLSEFERTSSGRDPRRDMSRKMTLTPSNAQPIQLTPLWEHVVRTREFPVEIDTRLTFLEIAERLRDPEWEVRQHALRVLMDVLPTLNVDILDKVMQPVLPELINNLGHTAPAVRKGALDTIRVYLVHTQEKESIVKNILRDGLNRSEAHDSFESNVTTGVILSTPSLLFPSSNSPLPSEQLIQDTTIALASRLAQVPHQEAVLKSLIKIRDAIGNEKFESCLTAYDDKLKKNIEILSKIYNIKPNKKRQKNLTNRNNDRIEKKESQLDRRWDSDSDTSGIAEEEEEIINGSSMPAARVVLETEIKFNEETAITMTILEEKADDSENEQDEESGTDVRNDAEVAEVVGDSVLEQRKTPRRVRFGGEIVKLRTPDSDETGSIELTPKTRIPLPVSPATRMPEHRRSSSQPCSPRREKRKLRREARSASNSPKREIYVHNADLSPKKSILTRTNSPLYIIKPPDHSAKKRSVAKNGERDNAVIKQESLSRRNSDAENLEISAQKIEESSKEENVANGNVAIENVGFIPIEPAQALEAKVSASKEANEDRCSTKNEERINKEESQNALQSAKTKTSFEAFPRQERNYILMELSSPESKASKQKRNDADVKRDTKSTDDRETYASVRKNNTKNIETTRRSSIEFRKPNSPFGSVVDEAEIDRDIFTDLNIDLDNKTAELSSPISFAKTEAKSEALKQSEKSTVSAATDVPRPDALTDADTGQDSTRDVRNLRKIKADREKRGRFVTEKNVIPIADAECKSKEPNWEELGLVGQEILEDLHNKEDWRARVRGFERVASALRTSSALIAIEPRLGSLLHAALGCERSCRVAAAGLAVAKIVVAGVSEDALKKRLSLLAWGLARQGGPNAAQLARIAMLRLRPILFLEQLLQPQCLNARNAKTRENALQLLIFSLVTFPSTEFRVQTVANKVVKMVSDRRRRVRQAALDTLAVLAQIYDPEEVLAAGKKAAERRHDGEAMLSAIRARLARKSLPLVSADGLVVYGLQISPTVQIATGPDVDWIVAGSGSVSPGTGRTRGQIIATTGSDKGRIMRSLHNKNRTNPWIERPNLVALGVGHSKMKKPVAWQIVPTQAEDDTGYPEQLNAQEEQNNNTEVPEGIEDDLTGQGLTIGRDSENSTNYPPSIRNNEEAADKAESRIPVLSSSRGKTTTQIRDRPPNSAVMSTSSTRRITDSTNSLTGSSENMLRPYSVAYQRRKKFQQENLGNRMIGANSSLNHSFDYYQNSFQSDSNRRSSDAYVGYNAHAENPIQESTEIRIKNYSRSESKERFLEREEETVSQFQTSTKIPHEITTVQELSNQRQPGRLVGSTIFRAVHPLDDEGQYYRYMGETINKSAPTRKLSQKMNIPSQKLNDSGIPALDGQANGYFPAIENEAPHRRRLRSLSPSQMCHRQHFRKLGSSEFQTMSMYDIDKAVNEEEYNERNKIVFLPDSVRHDEQRELHGIDPEFQENGEENGPKSASNSSSEDSKGNQQGNDGQNDKVDGCSRSSTPQSQETHTAFNVISNNTTPVLRDSVDSFVKLGTTMSGTSESIDEDTSKEWSSEDDIKLRDQILNRSELDSVKENDSNSTFDEVEDRELLNMANERRKSVISILSVSESLGNKDLPASNDSPTKKSPIHLQEVQSSPGRKVYSPKKVEILPTGQSAENYIDGRTSQSSQRSSHNSPQKVGFDFEGEDFSRSTPGKNVSSSIINESPSFQAMHTFSPKKERNDRESPTIIIASRPHSSLAAEYDENKLGRGLSIDNVDDAHRFVEKVSVNDGFDDGQSKDSASETNTEPAILRIESHTMEPIIPPRRIPSKVPRGTKSLRNVGTKGNPEKPSEKSKPMVQQCFAQLENKDWEVTMKGLKSLSQLAKQHPEYLDSCGAGTIGRTLGRLIKSLRSQVARTACLAAGDLFAAHIRSIDQDIDDIAGPLLHRTADTNKFLRADSNAALDRMMEHLPPHKTIGIIVHRGANHQNAIVRAATARLLAEIVDRVGPEHTMILPRDTRDKLLHTGARLLIDGNLDARNHAKKMFRRLTRCEGFRRALTDAVPESTLRHIDKALKSL